MDVKKAAIVRSFRTLIVLGVAILVAGCLPTTPAEAGVGALLLGFCCVLGALYISYNAAKVEGRKPAAWVALGTGLLIGGGFITLGGWWLGWWGK
jgi:hypothetical protein